MNPRVARAISTMTRPAPAFKVSDETFGKVLDLLTEYMSDGAAAELAVEIVATIEGQSK